MSQTKLIFLTLLICQLAKLQKSEVIQKHLMNFGIKGRFDNSFVETVKKCANDQKIVGFYKHTLNDLNSDMLEIIKI